VDHDSRDDDRRLYAAHGHALRLRSGDRRVPGHAEDQPQTRGRTDGQSLESVARVTTFDPDGNVVATFVARGTADRMQLEPIPDLP
jgi:hypothetical protein